MSAVASHYHALVALPYKGILTRYGALPLALMVIHWPVGVMIKLYASGILPQATACGHYKDTHIG
jgi:hypothetical protein